MALAPEHPLVNRITTSSQKEAVETYQREAARQTEIERLSTEKEKTGVFTGAYAINPVNGARIPIWVADYVLMTYGTGAIMAVPAHDERDFAFAKNSHFLSGRDLPADWHGEELAEAYHGEGLIVNSGPFDGVMAPHPAVEQVVPGLRSRGWAKGRSTTACGTG
jgi:leucyl-tRNA synthetase